MNKVLVLKAKPPVAGAETIAEQISAAHGYYNRLVELHRDFHGHADDLKRRHVPGLEEADAEVVAAQEAAADIARAIKQRNAAARRKQATREDSAALATARQRLKDARAVR